MTEIIILPLYSGKINLPYEEWPDLSKCPRCGSLGGTPQLLYIVDCEIRENYTGYIEVQCYRCHGIWAINRAHREQPWGIAWCKQRPPEAEAYHQSFSVENTRSDVYRQLKLEI